MQDESKSSQNEFNYHSLKAELYDSILLAVNNIFQQKSIQLHELQQRSLASLHLSQQRIIEQINEKHIKTQSKICNFQNLVRNFQILLEQNTDQVKMAHSSLDSTMIMFRMQEQELTKQTQRLKEESQQQLMHFQLFHTKIKNDLKEQSQQYAHKFNQVNNITTEHDRKIQDLETKSKLLFDCTGNHTKQLLSTAITISKIQEIIHSHTLQVKKINKMLREMEKLHLSFGQVQVKLSQLENFIDKYEPIYNYAQISDVMFSVLDDTGRKRLQRHDKITLDNFSITTSIDQGIPNLRLKVIKSKELLTKIILRNKPYEVVESQDKKQEKIQNFYEQKLEKEMEEFRQHFTTQMKQMKKMVFQKLDEICKQVTLEMTDNAETINFRIQKTEEKIDKIQEDIKNQKPREETVNYQQKPLSAVEINQRISNIARRVRRTTIREGSESARYEGLHNSRLYLKGSTSCLVPENLLQIRRKSMIDMNRNKITPRLD